MPNLLLGPLLRHVGADSATVWVETDRPCEVRVLDSVSRTFTVHGHHFALVEVGDVTGETPYQVHLDGEEVWPEPDSRFPPSVIRPKPAGEPVRVVFGSCRVSPAKDDTHGVDALSAFAYRLAAGHDWPDTLLMVGDQVYADETTPEMREFIEGRRDTSKPPGTEVADFEEYTQLYRLAWGENPAVRWLLSTVPSLMIFDDHDVRDDWNTSEIWREQMNATPWWRRRIVGGLGSYWIYQHLGNMPVEERAADPLYAKVRAADGDASELVDEFADKADREVTGTRWSYSHDFGRTRLIVVDSRCGRVLKDGVRKMLDDIELDWFRERCRGDFDHLLIGTSLPFLLPAAIHHLESFDEALAAGAWGKRIAGLGEKLRQGADLEHWAAFEESFRDVATTLLDVAHAENGPASITLLSGDVHYSYLARVTRPRVATPIAQVVCSPMRNPLVGKYKLANQIATKLFTDIPARALARLAGVPRVPMSWHLTHGPWFRNALATVTTHDRDATVQWEEAIADGSMTTVAQAYLTPPAE